MRKVVFWLSQQLHSWRGSKLPLDWTSIRSFFELKFYAFQEDSFVLSFFCQIEAILLERVKLSLKRPCIVIIRTPLSKFSKIFEKGNPGHKPRHEKKDD